MKKGSAIVLSIIGALAVIAAINPTMQAYAQNDVTADQSNSFTADISQSGTGGNGEYDEDGGTQSNTVDATQSNSFTADISQSGTGGNGEYDEDDGDVSQGFCLQSNQQNAAAGDDATNTGTNEIKESNCS